MVFSILFPPLFSFFSIFYSCHVISPCLSVSRVIISFHMHCLISDLFLALSVCLVFLRSVFLCTACTLNWLFNLSIVSFYVFLVMQSYMVMASTTFMHYMYLHMYLPNPKLLWYPHHVIKSLNKYVNSAIYTKEGKAEKKKRKKKKTTLLPNIPIHHSHSHPHSYSYSMDHQTTPQ